VPSMAYSSNLLETLSTGGDKSSADDITYNSLAADAIDRIKEAYNYTEYCNENILKNNVFFFNLKYKTNDILMFSDLLYSYYSSLFLLLGLILLSAMLGSIVLALSTIENNEVVEPKVL